MFRLFLLISLVLILVGAGTGYGLIAYKLELPPYNLAKNLYQKFSKGNPIVRGRPYIVDTDINELVQVKTATDVDRVREKLRDVLWGKGEFPKGKLAFVNTHEGNTRLPRIRGIGKIRDYVLDMEFGLQATMRLYLPENQTSSKLVIYHGAHGGRIEGARHLISPFLLEGYAVLGISMPLYDLNSSPVVNIPNIGPIPLTTHNHFMYLTPDSGIPVKYFVEPVVVALNHLVDQEDYNCVSMFGMSGGGWSSTIAPAVDERIQDSFSVAGTTPIFIKGRQLDDYEQNTPALYSQVNHFDMYVLAASGKNRKHFQIHNKYDPAYHRGHYTEIYEPIISNIVNAVGDGEFRVVMDDTHSTHSLSPAAFDLIFAQITGKSCD